MDATALVTPVTSVRYEASPVNMIFLPWFFYTHVPYCPSGRLAYCHGQLVCDDASDWRGKVSEVSPSV